jgi:acyl-CoA hydrolase
MSPPVELDRSAPDITRWLRAGDTVVVGEAASEPQALAAALRAAQPAVGALEVFLGVTLAAGFGPDAPSGMHFTSFGAMGRNTALARAGRLDVVASHYSQLPSLFDAGILRSDVVLVQLSLAPGESGYSLGPTHDYLVNAARRARVVIAEVNACAPWTNGAPWPADIRIDALLRSELPLPEWPLVRVGDVERRIAGHAIGFIGNGSTLEVGLGNAPEAVAAALSGHRNLGVHSGLITDTLLPLIDCGAIDNSRKPFDTGVSVAGQLFGTATLYRRAHCNPAFSVRPPSHTHDIRVLAALPAYTAINSALEVDLVGQVNAELAGRRYLGGVGGQVDFVRGAMLSAGGRSLTVLPSTASEGKASRIVARGPARVTTAHSDVDVVVTEWGAAQLRGQPLRERVRRMLAISDPRFRDGLEREARESGLLG